VTGFRLLISAAISAVAFRLAERNVAHAAFWFAVARRFALHAKPTPKGE